MTTPSKDLNTEREVQRVKATAHRGRAGAYILYASELPPAVVCRARLPAPATELRLPRGFLAEAVVAPCLRPNAWLNG